MGGNGIDELRILVVGPDAQSAHLALQGCGRMQSELADQVASLGGQPDRLRLVRDHHGPRLRIGRVRLLRSGHRRFAILLVTRKNFCLHALEHGCRAEGFARGSRGEKRRVRSPSGARRRWASPPTRCHPGRRARGGPRAGDCPRRRAPMHSRAKPRARSLAARGSAPQGNARPMPWPPSSRYRRCG